MQPELRSVPQSVGLSVMIPNFNYSKYIGETIASVLDQSPADVEVIVCDNASTDNSVAVVRAFTDSRVHLEVNPCNVGFAANLERCASFARGKRMLMLSSDDRMGKGAIDAYKKLEVALGARAERCIWGASTTVIDSGGTPTGTLGPDAKLWRDAVPEPELSAAVGHPVRSQPATALLRRSLELLRTPLPFASTCYPKSLHDAVGGYAGGRLMNPDKWFLWKILALAETVYIIDANLFDYRVHENSQANLESRSGALKHLTDQYISTFMLPEETLKQVGLQREVVAGAFIEQDIALRGLLALADGKPVTARRSVDFGLATYPDLARKNPKVWALRGLLRLGPVGQKLAKLAKDRALAKWRQDESTK